MQNYQLLTTRKRHTAVLYECFVFHKHKIGRKLGSVRYRCCHKENEQICGMAIHISLGFNEIVKIQGTHHHASKYDSNIYRKYEVIDELKQKVQGM